MKGSGVPGSPRSLRCQARNLEKRLSLRRQRVRMAAYGISEKMTSPGMLLAAVGVGVAVEQTSHHGAWSMSGILNATTACIKLFLSLSTARPSAGAELTHDAE